MTWGRVPGGASAALITVNNEAVIEETQDGLGHWVPAAGSGG